ncbi:hypothetical protein HAX54_012998 [Datura stramonium]|uniref:Uncharacterized protein n=1 Tax=Datura stramonium TaxID=4076 RepID=A0ABS8RXW0_DATST|nr:hypothetical protein [Datura stramonium]
MQFVRAYAEEEVRREAKERREDYGASSQSAVNIATSNDKSSLLASGSENTRSPPQYHQEKPQITKSSSPSIVLAENHEHVFLVEDQTVDEESSTRTKRCRCGFSVQYEEL